MVKKAHKQTLRWPAELGAGQRSLSFFHEFGHNGRIGQGSDVAQIGGVIGSYLSEDPSHDFAASRLRESAGEDDVIRQGERADRSSHALKQLSSQVVIRSDASLQSDEQNSPDPLTSCG
eukprot:CAMPEP_0206515284 /NCGR_PEP_ID=MMETSP0324_2-20121206/62694_1 /ASSEMBLY_ACC=CAM_ASM_000836 /TAXON_ID=2866 /ORGANISM="Crypthecodinium cohnii, Strain Seligo" /LENGTH=118 /DNA_ID=CAMNT_0054008025 /DNA_START=26 /DNA_END=383 /DNA_ORIENTATION=-